MKERNIDFASFPGALRTLPGNGAPLYDSVRFAEKGSFLEVLTPSLFPISSAIFTGKFHEKAFNGIGFFRPWLRTRNLLTAGLLSYLRSS